MYAEVLKGQITHYRGDTLSVPIKLYEGDRLAPTDYHLTENDTLYLGIMEPNQAFEDAVIKKVYTHESVKDTQGNILLQLKSTDTEYVAPGKYYYTLKLRRVVDDATIVETVLKPTIFNLLGHIPVKG